MSNWRCKRAMESWLSTESYIALECGSNFKAVLRFEPAYLSIYLFILAQSRASLSDMDIQQ